MLASATWQLVAAVILIGVTAPLLGGSIRVSSSRRRRAVPSTDWSAVRREAIAASRINTAGDPALRARFDTIDRVDRVDERARSADDVAVDDEVASGWPSPRPPSRVVPSAWPAPVGRGCPGPSQPRRGRWPAPLAPARDGRRPVALDARADRWPAPLAPARDGRRPVALDARADRWPVPVGRPRRSWWAAPIGVPLRTVLTADSAPVAWDPARHPRRVR